MQSFFFGGGRGGGGGIQGVLWEMCKWRMSVFQRDHK